ncbi:unnamed protein product [Rhodiola kirilowii]
MGRTPCCANVGVNRGAWWRTFDNLHHAQGRRKREGSAPKSRFE